MSPLSLHHQGWHLQDLRQCLKIGLPLQGGLLALTLPVGNGRKRGHRPRLYFEIEVFGEPLDEAKAFGEGSAALEPDLQPRIVKSPKGMGQPLVLLHQTWIEMEAATYCAQ